MEKREFKIGDKVKIPKTKSKDLMTSLEDCTAIQNAKRLNQNYLYITRIIEDQYELGVEIGHLDSAFGIQDLEHYEEEEFVLPKCWFVLYNTLEEFDIINQFYGKGWSYCSYKNKFGYHNNGDNQIHSNNWAGSDKASKEKLLKNGYIQITFEQFQKYILKQETMKKEIIGYKLIKPNYEREALSIANISKFDFFQHDSLVYKHLKEAGVLDLWFEPVYKEEKQIIQMYSSNKGMFEIEVKDGKAYYRPENKHLPKEWIRDIINSYGNILIQKNVINPYNVEISSINVGCYHNCKKEDWENVYKLLK